MRDPIRARHTAARGVSAIWSGDKRRGSDTSWWGLGCRVLGSRFGVQDLRLRHNIWKIELILVQKNPTSVFRVQGSEFKV